jgi:hypothetical protein
MTTKLTPAERERLEHEEAYRRACADAAKRLLEEADEARELARKGDWRSQAIAARLGSRLSRDAADQLHRDIDELLRKYQEETAKLRLHQVVKRFINS